MRLPPIDLLKIADARFAAFLVGGGLRISLPFLAPPSSRFRLTLRHHVEIAIALVLTIISLAWIWYRRDYIFVTDAEGAIHDPMLTSGFLVAISGLVLSLFIDRRYLAMIRQVETEQLLSLSHAQLEDLNTEMQDRCRRFRILIPAFLVPLMLAAYILVWVVSVVPFNGVPPAMRNEFLVGSLLLAGLIGHRMGTVVAYGGLAKLLEDRRAMLRLSPNHPDGAGGAHLIGGFLIFQGALAAIPVIWLTIWIVLIDGWSYYEQWRLPFYALWAFGLFVMYHGFVAPVMRLARLYGDAREGLIDRLIPATDTEIAAAHVDMAAARDYATGTAASKRLSDAVDFRRAVMALPSLPLSPLSRRFFNAASLLPLITIGAEILVDKDSLVGKAFGYMVDVLSNLLP